MIFPHWILFLFSCSSLSVEKINLTLSKFTASPDGFETTYYGYNQELFHPIHVQKNSNLLIHLQNNMDEESTVHFHGLFQNSTPFYDGPIGIAQCAIAPSSSFDYQFSTGNQHGTYWYHSHHRAQYAKGLRNPFIIHDPDNEPFTKDYDEEYVIMMSEWYHAPTTNDLLVPFLSSDNDQGAEPVPQSILINGQGRYDCSKKKTGKCQSNHPLATFDFVPGKRYRLR